MEHVTIISQEAITKGSIWPVTIAGLITITVLIGALIDLAISHNAHRTITITANAACFGILAILLMAILTVSIFQVPTGRYRYEGTFDPDMTITEFEEFQEQYSNVRFEEGIWKWEDKE